MLWAAEASFPANTFERSFLNLAEGLETQAHERYCDDRRRGGNDRFKKNHDSKSPSEVVSVPIATPVMKAFPVLSHPELEAFDLPVKTTGRTPVALSTAPAARSKTLAESLALDAAALASLAGAIAARCSRKALA